MLSNSRIISQTLHSSAPESSSIWIHSSDSLWRRLRAERARIHRRGGNLSLITIPARTLKNHLITLEQFVVVLGEHLREADFAGPLGGGKLAIVFHSTHTKDALLRVEEILSCLKLTMKAAGCQIHSYPNEDHLTDNNNDLLPTAIGAGRVQSGRQFFLQPMPIWKRSLDILGAGLGLIALAPLMAILALAVRLTSSGPILFRQRRGGLGGKPFTMLKFRSMVVDAEELKLQLMDQNEQDGPAFKITHDPRVTKIGKFLRGTSLDELPQLWNVLKGEMSLVGPRPLPVAESEACSPWQQQRLDVTPGITCFWQCQSGKRVTFDEWMRMDIRYAQSRSLKLDLRLILKTLLAVASHKALKHNGLESNRTNGSQSV